MAEIEREMALAGHAFSVQQILRADYAICRGEDLLAVIERKSLKDLAASIKDGRLQNLKGLIELREECNCDVWLLIEGPAFPTPTRKFQRIAYATLESCIIDASVRQGIFRVPAKNGADSARVLARLVDRYKRHWEIQRGAGRRLDGAPVAAGGAPATNTLARGGAAGLMRPVVVTEIDTVSRMWAASKGITAHTGFEFAKLGAIADLVAIGAVDRDALEARLGTVRHPGSGRRIHAAATARVMRLLTGHAGARDALERFLSGVPRLSRAVAAQVCAGGVTLPGLVAMDAEALSALVPEGARRRLGKSGERLHALLRVDPHPPAEGANSSSDDGSSSDDSSDDE
jgi:hypothetical protein